MDKYQLLEELHPNYEVSEDELDALNEGFLTGLAIFVGLHMFLIAYLITDAAFRDLKERNNFKFLINAYIKNKNLNSFAEKIKSIRQISFNELIKYLNIKGKEKDEILKNVSGFTSDYRIISIFDNNENLLGWASYISREGKIVYGTKNSKLKKEEIFLLNLLIEYHYKIKGKFYKDLLKMKLKVEKSKDNENIYKKDKTSLERNNDLDLNDEKLLNDVIKESTLALNIIKNDIKKCKYYNEIYKYSINSKEYRSDDKIEIDSLPYLAYDDYDSNIASIIILSDLLSDYPKDIQNKYFKKYKYQDDPRYIYLEKIEIYDKIKDDITKIILKINNTYKYIKCTFDPVNNDLACLGLNIKLKF